MRHPNGFWMAQNDGNPIFMGTGAPKKFSPLLGTLACTFFHNLVNDILQIVSFINFVFNVYYQLLSTASGSSWRLRSQMITEWNTKSMKLYSSLHVHTWVIITLQITIIVVSIVQTKSYFIFILNMMEKGDTFTVQQSYWCWWG